MHSKNIIGLLFFFGIVNGFIQFSCNQGNSTENLIADTRSTFFFTLSNTDTLSIEIKTNFESIYENKKSPEKHYQNADLKAFNNDEEIFNQTIQVRPRGITRKRICDFPPLMLKLPNRIRKELNFIDTDNIKLLTYCKDNDLYHSYVLKEYLNYKLCNELFDHSFKVKLARIKYIDSGDTYPSMEQIGFIIEPEDQLVSRLGCKLLPEDRAIKTVHKDHYKSLVVFQYMIGNSDWNFSKRHNVIMVNCNTEYGPMPVPYDFDFSGLVNAEYAEPHPSLPIKSVKDRLFQWRGSPDEQFTETYRLFESKKSSFYKICQELPYLNDEAKSEVKDYLDDFYQNISSEAFMKKEILKARS